MKHGSETLLGDIVFWTERPSAAQRIPNGRQAADRDRMPSEGWRVRGLLSRGQERQALGTLQQSRRVARRSRRPYSDRDWHRSQPIEGAGREKPALRKERNRDQGTC